MSHDFIYIIYMCSERTINFEVKFFTCTGILILGMIFCGIFCGYYVQIICKQCLYTATANHRLLFYSLVEKVNVGSDGKLLLHQHVNFEET